MKLKLSPPHFKDNFGSLLKNRASCRNFKNKALDLAQIASILWATGGKKFDAITAATRTIPSAGATYPLELYLVVGNNSVDKLESGIYHYLIEEHALELVKEGDNRAELSEACLGQDFIKDAPVSLLIAAEFGRTTNRYSSRGERYVHIEVGHACQNTYLAVTSLGLGTVEVGAFHDNQVKKVLGLDKDRVALILMPIGYPQ